MSECGAIDVADKIAAIQAARGPVDLRTELPYSGANVGDGSTGYHIIVGVRLSSGHVISTQDAQEITDLMCAAGVLRDE